eukprot:TRINITY_DN774074_c0_g1_i1.p1 TRINITY_DN774074_c0_g1~~TRINITY_DN774074_c0_g1_i1.p1  ORF type:complete len:273 (-),score=48.54 TRINITY_DN774074_c0_g1_i1:253-1071(-)
MSLFDTAVDAFHVAEKEVINLGSHVPTGLAEYVKHSYYTVPLWEPIVGVVIYFLVNKLLTGHRISDKTARIFSIVHNIILIVFSASCVIGTALVLANNWEWNKIFDDECHHMMDNTYAYFLGYLFYISKFYEFFDTWLIILKGKKPSFLQTFHHAGTAWSMACMMHFRSEGLWTCIILNCFVHTIMYTYYLLTVFGIRPWWKKYITMMQIVQFCVGTLVGVPLFMKSCSWDYDNGLFGALSHIQCQLFVFVLLFLFTAFFKQSYKKKSPKKE